MKKEIPKDFLNQYENIKDDLQKVLDYIHDTLKLRISQLKTQKGTRARMVGTRLKRPGCHV